jgi:hypothetical protein
MIFDLEPMIFPPRNVGGEFVRKVLIAGLLSFTNLLLGLKLRYLSTNRLHLGKILTDSQGSLREKY